MTVYKQDYEAAKSHLWPDEVVEVTATQRNFAPGGSLITPTTLVATDKRVLIINRASGGFRKDIESIPYYRITSVRFENGIISSSVFLRIEGYTNPGAMAGLLKEGKEWGQIDGLRHKDAKAISEFINKKLSEIETQRMATAGRVDSAPRFGRGGEGEAKQGSAAQSGAGGTVYCNECGSRNPSESRFCSECGHKLK